MKIKNNTIVKLKYNTNYRTKNSQKTRSCFVSPNWVHIPWYKCSLGHPTLYFFFETFSSRNPFLIQPWSLCIWWKLRYAVLGVTTLLLVLMLHRWVCKKYISLIKYCKHDTVAIRLLNVLRILYLFLKSGRNRSRL